jgi:signal transduction histidine kinase
MKLLDNACKFTPPTGTVTIDVKPLPKYLEITIIDTGCGIEPKRLENIFERFYQEEGFLQRAIGGTGLGLAISRQIARRLGGKLWAKSSGKGKGSQFHFTLPIAPTETPAP